MTSLKANLRVSSHCGEQVTKDWQSLMALCLQIECQPLIIEALYRNSNAERNIKSLWTEEPLWIALNAEGDHETMRRVLSYRCVFFQSSCLAWLWGQVDGLQTSWGFAAGDCQIMWYGHELTLKWERMSWNQAEQLGNITASCIVRINVDLC